MTAVITMHIETEAGVKAHPFHLGTDHKIAERFALEQVATAGVKSVALRQNGNVLQIYDFRDIAPQEGA